MHVTSQATSAYESASAKFLPVIDLNPSDERCAYSTLLFVIEEAKKLNIPCPCITFDQPLLQKAMGIIKGKKSTKSMSVRWIPHINELSKKYRESHE